MRANKATPRPTQTRYKLGIRAVALVAIAVFIAGCGDDDGYLVSSSTTQSKSKTTVGNTSAVPTTKFDGHQIDLQLYDGEFTGVDDLVEVSLDETVRITVLSDIADELHVHGYDEKLAFVPGQPAELTFSADVPGSFEVELEGSHKKLFTLRVQ